LIETGCFLLDPSESLFGREDIGGGIVKVSAAGGARAASSFAFHLQEKALLLALKTSERTVSP